MSVAAVHALARYLDAQSARPGWRLMPRLTELEVGAVEEHLGVALPIEYREFLLHVGSGWERCCLLSPQQALLELGGGRPWEAFPFDNEEATAVIARDLARAAGAPRPALDGESPPDGALRLIDEGCGTVDYLILTGPQRGTVWQEWDLGFTPHYALRNGRPVQLTFLAWLNEHYIAAGSGSRAIPTASHPTS